MTLHAHWHRPVGPVRGPFRYSHRASRLVGTRTRVCRCGSTRAREEVAMPDDLGAVRAAHRKPPPPSGRGAASDPWSPR